MNALRSAADPESVSVPEPDPWTPTADVELADSVAPAEIDNSSDIGSTETGPVLDSESEPKMRSPPEARTVILAGSANVGAVRSAAAALLRETVRLERDKACPETTSIATPPLAPARTRTRPEDK